MSNEQSPELVLSRERLQVAGVSRHPSERVLLRRRVVSEVQMMEVTVRREELVVDREPFAGALTDGEPLRDPVVIVLSQEVPTVQMSIQPYERVTATVHAVAVEQVLSVPVQVEQAELEMVDVASDPTTSDPTTSGPTTSGPTASGRTGQGRA